MLRRRRQVSLGQGGLGEELGSERRTVGDRQGVLPRLRDAARPQQQFGDLDPGRRGISAGHIKGPAVGIERCPRPATALQDLSQFVPCQDEPRLGLEHRAQRRLGTGQIAFRAEADGSRQVLDRADPALRVG